MNVLFKRSIHALLCLSAVWAMVFLTGCATTSSKDNEPAWASREAMDPGRLQMEDMVVVVFSGVPAAPERFEGRIKPSGTNGVITLALVGEVIAAGKSPAELEQSIKAAYLGKRLYKDTLNVTVNAESRVFAVIGEVRNSNRFVHSGEIKLLGAISTAGGFTDFADKKDVQVLRRNGKVEHVNCRRAIKNPNLNLPIYPGDQIYVPRRLY